MSTTQPVPLPNSPASPPLAESLRPGIRLATPAERPQADVVIYDGDCRFCTGQVKNLAWLDGGQRLAFISLHDPLVAERYPNLTHEQLMEQMYVVDQQGNQYAGAAAFRYLTRRLPWLYILAPILHIPFSLPLWQWAYRQVAKRRYLIMGKNSSQPVCDDDKCSVHFK